MNGKSVIDLFNRYRVIDYIDDYYEAVFVNLKLCHFQWKFQLKIVPVFYYAPSVMVTQKEVERR